MTSSQGSRKLVHTYNYFSFLMQIEMPDGEYFCNILNGHKGKWINVGKIDLYSKV